LLVCFLCNVILHSKNCKKESVTITCLVDKLQKCETKLHSQQKCNHLEEFLTSPNNHYTCCKIFDDIGLGEISMNIVMVLTLTDETSPQCVTTSSSWFNHCWSPHRVSYSLMPSPKQCPQSLCNSWFYLISHLFE
jgi:hypothetical protein